MFVGKTEYPDFVNALLSAPWYSRFIAKSTAGGNGAIGNLNKNSLMKTLIFKPSLSEMDCIGYMFSMIDSLITLHQKKLCYKRLKCKINLTMFALETHFYHVDFNLVSKGSRLNIMQCVD